MPQMLTQPSVDLISSAIAAYEAKIVANEAQQASINEQLKKILVDRVFYVLARQARLEDVVEDTITIDGLKFSLNPTTPYTSSPLVYLDICARCDEIISIQVTSLEMLGAILTAKRADDGLLCPACHAFKMEMEQRQQGVEPDVQPPTIEEQLVDALKAFIVERILAPGQTGAT